MTAKEVFSKTLVFGWIKLGLGLLNILIAIVLFAILMGISVLFASEGVGAIMFFIWLVALGVVNFIINHYIGYLVKAGHVASNSIQDRHRTCRLCKHRESHGQGTVRYIQRLLCTGQADSGVDLWHLLFPCFWHGQ